VSRLIDYYGEFVRATHSCSYCRWSGLGADMKSGLWFNDGVEKHCPQCGEKIAFVKWSVTEADDADPRRPGSGA
jgi:hypothetical protein